MSDHNAQVIAEFRANDGQVGGPFEGRPLLLLHHLGAKTGTERVNPMMYQDVDGRYAVFASKAGAPDNPDWFNNLVTNPRASIEIGSETKEVRARVAEGDERDRIWTTQKRLFTGFADYEARTDREIPVVILEPID